MLHEVYDTPIDKHKILQDEPFQEPNPDGQDPNQQIPPEQQGGEMPPGAGGGGGGEEMPPEAGGGAQQPGMMSPGMAAAPPAIEIGEDEEAEYTPLRKYNLVIKLQNLSMRLSQQNIYNQNLDTVIQFASNISYETLLKLSQKLTEEIKKQLREVENEYRKKI